MQDAPDHGAQPPPENGRRNADDPMDDEALDAGQQLPRDHQLPRQPPREMAPRPTSSPDPPAPRADL
eukprot:6066620-Lingulodinium_polyedra.AAC.1